ncbi:NAD(P)-binding protein [Glonium stellatum]|uniref:NAD(P)-binding protein n=1 Tax=Glonium stellatum TaxID=574774 RepID=A0A8E2FAG4_9PEZI|nr:NAD(P)-binding protein [Glonium stellatum]
MALTNVALIGANGHLGPSVLHILLSAPHLNITVLTRASSASTYPSSVHTITIPDSLPVQALGDALCGQDALVVTMAGNRVAEQIKLADAAYTAGVKRIILADFGSCDSADEYTQALLPLMAGKAKREGSTLSWTSIVTGHFFDYGLKGGLLRFDLPKRRAQLLDGGEMRWSACTLERIGVAVLRVLEREKETRNRLLYVQKLLCDRVIEEKREGLEKGDGDAIEEVVSRKEGFANVLLGLDEENLEDVVRRVIESM